MVSSARAQPPAASPEPSPSPAASPSADAAELRRRLAKVEADNVRLAKDVAALKAQLDALTESYVHHYHQVNGVVGNGLDIIDGKTVVTGSYAEIEERRTGAPQPPYHPPLTPSPAPLRKPAGKAKPAAKNAKALPSPAAPHKPKPSPTPKAPSPSGAKP